MKRCQINEALRGPLGASIALLGAALGLGGCATSLTTATTAEALEPGEFALSGSLIAQVHTDALGAALDTIEDAEAEARGESQPLTEERARELGDRALKFALFRPSISNEFVARTGLASWEGGGLDVALKTNFALYKGELKAQVYESEDKRQAVALMGGAAYHSDWTGTLVNWLVQTEFSRYDLDLQLLYTYSIPDFVYVTLAPHLVISKIDPTQKGIPGYIEDRLPEQSDGFNPNQFFQDEWMAYYGANVNLMIGYKYVFLTLDAGVFYLDLDPTVIGEVRDFDSIAVSIGPGVALRFAI